MAVNPGIKNLVKEAVEQDSTQSEFLDDIRVSLQEMQAGKVLPAAEALDLIELGLQDDELEGRLSE